MKIRALLPLLLLLSLTACGGDGTAEASDADGATADASAIDCAPLTVTIDGEPVDGLTHAFAYSEPETGPGTGGFGVDVFNHGASCADVLAGSRDVPEGEVHVKAFVQEASGRGSVAVGSKTNFAQGVELLRKAEATGEPVAICVSNVKWTAGGFGGDGPTYEISGLFQGEYCGERTR